LPGLGASVGAALIMPFIFRMESAQALVAISSIWTTSRFGGAITTIILNIPRTASNAPTAFDGYPMMCKGEGIQAVSEASMGSLMGAILVP